MPFLYCCAAVEVCQLCPFAITGVQLGPLSANAITGDYWHSPQAEYAEQGLCNCRVCVCYSVHLTAVAAGLLLSAMWTADRLSIHSGGRPWARALSSKCGPRQCHRDSRVDEDECRFRRVKKLNADISSQLPPRRPVSLLLLGEQRHDGCEQFA